MKSNQAQIEIGQQFDIKRRVGNFETDDVTHNLKEKAFCPNRNCFLSFLSHTSGYSCLNDGVNFSIKDWGGRQIHLNVFERWGEQKRINKFSADPCQSQLV